MDAQAATSSHFINFRNVSHDAIVADAVIFNEGEEEVDPTMLCRICSATCKTFMPIYEGEGLDNKLAEKINNYLPITVEDGDYLPDKICSVCVNTLIGWDELVRCCIKSNDTLTEMLDKAENINIFKLKPAKTKPPVNGKSKSRERKSTHKRKTSHRYSGLKKCLKVCDILDDELHSIDIKKDPSDLEDDIMNEPMDNYDSSDDNELLSKLKPRKYVEFNNYEENSKSEIESDRNQNVLCHLCRMQIVAKNYINHIRNHIDEKLFTCEQCGKSFKCAQNIQRHVRQVHEKFRYPCDSCEKTFRTNSHLQEHIKMHSKNGYCPYVCDTCGKVYTCHDRFSQHCKRHAKLKYHAELTCPHCPKTFIHKAYLDRHIIIHSTERPFPCLLCPRKFKSPRFVKVHVRRKHLMKLPK